MQLVPVGDSFKPPAHTSGPQSALDVGNARIGCCPAGQVKGMMTHALRLVAPVRVVVLPCSHSRHCSRDVAPVEDAYRPMGQGVQGSCRCGSSEYRPTAQGTGTDEPLPHQVPRGHCPPSGSPNGVLEPRGHTCPAAQMPDA